MGLRILVGAGGVSSLVKEIFGLVEIFLVAGDEIKFCECHFGYLVSRHAGHLPGSVADLAAYAVGVFYGVFTASNGKEALELLHTHNADMIVCDWMMPEMDGLTLLKNIRGNTALSHLPFIMLTAKTDINSKIESLKQGADAYVEKPFSMAFLKARIANLIDMRRMLTEKFVNTPLTPFAALATHPEEDEFLSRLNEVIEENIGNHELNVDFLAAKLMIGRTSLFNKIRSLADMTPNKLIQVARLKKGAELLLEGKCPVKDIAYSVGFNNESYFTKCFTQQFGVNPTKFAASNSAAGSDSATLAE